MVTNAEMIIKRQTRRLRRSLIWLFVILILLQAAIYAGIIYLAWGEPLDQWAPELLFSTLILVAALVIALRIIRSQGDYAATSTQRVLDNEMMGLRSVQGRYESLLAMTTALSATLEAERLIKVALELCENKLKESGKSGSSYATAALLFTGRGLLKPLAGVGLSERDLELTLAVDGIVAGSLEKGEPQLSSQLNQDPAVAQLTTFRDSISGVCIPLRSGTNLFGFIILGRPEATPFSVDDVVLLKAIADLTAPALQIEELRSQYTAEIWKILKAEDAERLAVARTLRDGPAQQLTGGAMRLGFIHGSLVKNPNQALSDLKKIEAEFHESAKELREVSFILRPMLNMMGKSLDLAIREVIQRIHKIGNLQVDFSGGEKGKSLTTEAQIIVHYIIEAALFWAQQHGRAGRAAVSFRVDEETFIARVEDNGTGGGWFQESQSRSQRDLPLIIMRERAGRIDGTLHVDQGTAGGRIVTLVVPLATHGQGLIG